MSEGGRLDWQGQLSPPPCPFPHLQPDGGWARERFSASLLAPRCARRKRRRSSMTTKASGQKAATGSSPFGPVGLAGSTLPGQWGAGQGAPGPSLWAPPAAQETPGPRGSFGGLGVHQGTPPPAFFQLLHGPVVTSKVQKPPCPGPVSSLAPGDPRRLPARSPLSLSGKHPFFSAPHPGAPTMDALSKVLSPACSAPQKEDSECGEVWLHGQGHPARGGARRPRAAELLTLRPATGWTLDTGCGGVGTGVGGVRGWG